MRVVTGWVWWGVAQGIMGVLAVIGWILLIPFCLLQFWSGDFNVPSIGDKERKIDVWRWVWLNKIYGNPEDGVSGRQALIWVNGVLSPYMPPPKWLRPVKWQMWLWNAWRAYCWSAWRNSTDNMKYVFAWKNGPRAAIFGHKVGWWPENGFNVPVW